MKCPWKEIYKTTYGRDTWGNIVEVTTETEFADCLGEECPFHGESRDKEKGTIIFEECYKAAKESII